jgi:hypothetical protein
MDLIARINTFRGIPNFEIDTALKSGFGLENRDAYIFGYTWINRRFVNYDAAFR